LSFDLSAGAVKRSQARGGEQAQGAEVRSTEGASDGGGYAPPTGAVAASKKALGNTPEAAAGGDGGQDEARSWKDSAAVQGIGGFAAGLAIGFVPFGGLGELGLSWAKVLDEGTPAARIGKSLGEMIGAQCSRSAGSTARWAAPRSA
jgi:hypothetical protein